MLWYEDPSPRSCFKRLAGPHVRPSRTIVLAEFIGSLCRADYVERFSDSHVRPSRTIVLAELIGPLMLNASRTPMLNSSAGPPMLACYRGRLIGSLTLKLCFELPVLEVKVNHYNRRYKYNTVSVVAHSIFVDRYNYSDVA